MFIQDTPVEPYNIDGKQLFVKREDLACLPPGPPFAKVRGLYPVLIRLKKQGVKTIGYMDTAISMAGWGISYFCSGLVLNSVLFMPSYRAGFLHNQEFQFSKWTQFGASIVRLENPNRMRINFYRAKRMLVEKYPDSAKTA